MLVVTLCKDQIVISLIFCSSSTQVVTVADLLLLKTPCIKEIFYRMLTLRCGHSVMHIMLIMWCTLNVVAFRLILLLHLAMAAILHLLLNHSMDEMYLYYRSDFLVD